LPFHRGINSFTGPIKKMKATNILLTVVLSLSLNVVLAENDITTYPSDAVNQSLIPVTPSEATFEETITGFVNLEPSVPAEADFNDAPSSGYYLLDLQPEVPSEADFE